MVLRHLWLLLVMLSAAANGAEDLYLKEKAALSRDLAQGRYADAVPRLLALAQFDTPEAATHLVSLANTPDGDLFAGIREALGTIGNEKAVSFLFQNFTRSTSEAQWESRALLASAFAGRRSEQGLKALASAVSDSHSKVRLAAIRGLALGKLPAADTIPLLIKALERAEHAGDFGVPHYEIRVALVRLTGYDFALARGWEAFWKTNGATFDPEKKGPKTEAEFKEDLAYFEAPVISRRMLFILDTSASMNLMNIDRYDDTPKTGIRPVKGGGADRPGSLVSGPEWDKWLEKHPEAVRIELAKLELSALIEKLPKDAMFNIVCFNSKVEPWKPALIPATESNKKDAQTFLKRLSPRGHTRGDLALEEAFKSNGQADTIYFLSDGRPSADGQTDLPTEPILKRVRLLNRSHRMFINTFDAGGEGVEFMKALAEQNGGTFKDLHGKPAKK